MRRLITGGCGAERCDVNPSFALAGAAACGADVPKAQIHVLEAGHFAMDEDLADVAKLTHEFLDGLRLGGG